MTRCKAWSRTCAGLIFRENISLIFEDLQHRRQEEWWLTPPPPPLPSRKKTIRIFLGDRLLCPSVRSVNSLKAIYYFAHIMQVVVVLIRWESITFWRGVWATQGIYTPWSPLCQHNHGSWYVKYQQFTSMLKGSLPPYSYLLWEGSIVMSLFASSLSARSAVMACQERVYRAAGENGQECWAYLTYLTCKSHFSLQDQRSRPANKGSTVLLGRMVKCALSLLDL